jgi:uncharacterized lipoprotein YehR (DUF1307 family)
MKNFITLFVVVFAITVVIALLYIHKEDNKRIQAMKFNGIVQNVQYSDKGNPSVKISNKDYILSVNIDFDYQIQEGDTLKKEKGTMLFELGKKNGKILKFKY